MSQKPTKRKIAKKPKANKVKRKITPGFIVTILSVFVSAILVIALAASAVATLIISDILKGTPTMNVNDFISPDSTKIYDADGEIIADIGLHLRENITYEQMPQSLVDAFVSVEDARFFTHNGFDLPRFSKAILTNIQTGRFAEGGSTFTMQLIKNTYFATDDPNLPFIRSIDRKFQEIDMAIQLEDELSKKRILELYVNKVNYGVPNSLGIQNAAQYYFDKDVEQLNLSESAFLAGVINAPNLNNPYRYLENGTKRRNQVLSLMLRHGYIDQQEYEAAKSIRLEDLLAGNTRETGEAIAYQSYIDAVVEETVRLTGQDPYVTPMNIYTHMNREMQDHMDAISNEEVLDFGHDLIQMAAMSMDHRTGEVIAISGGRNYSGQRVFNRALNSTNQPGSSIKPLLSYALAFEYLGYATSHVIRDEPMAYRGTNIQIQNYNRRYEGDMTFEYALGVSKNIPAVALLQEIVDTVGVARVSDYLNAVGFDQITPQDFVLGYALGAMEVSVEQMTGAYGALLNQGVYIKPHFVSRIEFRDGREPIIPTYASTRALSAESAYLASSLMENNVSGGYANLMGILRKGYPVYAKTGTSDWGREGLPFGIPEGAAKDHWLVGGTNKYINTVWLGFDRAESGKQTWTTTAWDLSNVKGQVINSLLNKQGEIENNQFGFISRPSGVVNITHILGTYPYANVIDGMDPSLITSGMIKREFANLTNLQVEPPERLESMTPTLSISGNTNTVTLSLSTYPNPEDLEVAPSTVDMELNIGNRVVRATGTRMFDASWIFGPVRYIGQVRVNNNTYTEISESNNITLSFDGQIDSNIEVCGFYGYEKNIESRSNQVCQTLDISAASVTVPAFTTLAEFESWAARFNITNITKTPVAPSNIDQLGRVQSIRFNGEPVVNRTLSIKELREGAFTVNYFDARIVNVDFLRGKLLSEISSWNEYQTFQYRTTPSNTSSGRSWRITDVIFNDESVTQVFVVDSATQKPRLTLVVEEVEQQGGSN